MLQSRDGLTQVTVGKRGYHGGGGVGVPSLGRNLIVEGRMKRKKNRKPLNCKKANMTKSLCQVERIDNGSQAKCVTLSIVDCILIPLYYISMMSYL